MAEPDPESLHQVFAAEPPQPSPAQAARWVEIYERLTEILARHADETRALAQSVPDAMREYLDGENLHMLNTELEAFEKRLAYWRGIASAPATDEHGGQPLSDDPPAGGSD